MQDTKHSLTRFSKPLLALCLSLVLAVVSAELLLRLLFPSPSLRCGWKPTNKPSGEQNQLGFRGEFFRKRPGEFVVLLVGDSQVVAEALPFSQLPERLLQQQLHLQGQTRVRVRSLAGIGWGQAEQLLALKRYFRRGYRADLVVLWFTPENDVWNNIFPTAWGHKNLPKPTYWLAGNTLKGPLCTRHAPLPRWHLQRWWKSAQRRGLAKRWNHWLPAGLPKTKDSQKGDATFLALWKQNHWPVRNEKPFVQKTHLLLRQFPVTPRATYGIRLTQHLLQEIKQVSQKNKARFALFVAEPALGTRYLFQRNYGKKHIFRWNGSQFTTSQAQYKANLRTIARGLPFYSLKLFTTNWRVSLHDAHFNQTANAEAMRLLAQHLRIFTMPLHTYLPRHQ